MKQILMATLSLWTVIMAQGAEYFMTGDDVAPTSSLIDGTNWDNGQPPAVGNSYRTAKLLRTPENSNHYIFAGDQLTLDTSATFAWKSAGNLTVSNLVFNGGTLAHWMSNGARLYGCITVNPGKTFVIQAVETSARWFEIYAPISGSGAIELQMYQTNTLKQASFFGDNSGFTGQIRLRGKGKFGICSETGLGANPAAFTYNRLDFGGTTLIITNSLTLDDPNRGLHLNTLNTGFNVPGGVFEINNQATATIACLISGAGPLTKRGNGTLLLATNHTYTGITTVEAGTLRLALGASLASPAVTASGPTSVIAGEGTLHNVTLAGGGRLATEKGGLSVADLSVLNTTEITFAVDLSEADPETALIRVGGALTKQPLQVFQFTINTNNTTAVPYQLLTAPNLADFADFDFCVSPPWIGQLSRAEDGLGGDILLFTPTPPQNIITKKVTDNTNESAFTEGSKWSDGMAPTPDKSYLYNNGYTLRTPQNGSLTFNGGQLIIDKSATLALKGAGTPTIPDLVMMNDAVFGMWEGAGSRMAGAILLYPLLEAGRSYAMRVTSSNMGRDLDLTSTLSGYGDLLLQAQGDPAYDSTSYFLNGDNSDYFGKIRVDGNSNLWLTVTSEINIGGLPPAFRPDQLVFNGGGIRVTNHVVLDDPGRGITLLATGGTSPVNTGAGAFLAGTTPEQRRYEGGGTFRPEPESVTLTVNCPVTGPGRLIKEGTGTLVLGGDNSYTGVTQISAGRLEPVTASALGTGPVLLKPAGRLLRRYPGAPLPAGVELGGAISFESGSAVRVELDAGQSLTGKFTLPLFLLAEGESLDPADVPIEHEFKNYRAVVSNSTLGSRVLVSVTLTFQGTLLMLQ